MWNALASVLVALSLVGCKREVKPEPVPAPAPAPAPAASQDAAVAAAPRDASVADHGPTWYRASLRSADGVEVWFFLGVPAPGAPGQAIFKVGNHEVRGDATFDGKTLRVPLTVHQTAVEASVEPDGSLRGTFTTSWRAWGASSIPLTATKVEAPTLAALATAGSQGAALDL